MLTEGWDANNVTHILGSAPHPAQVSAILLTILLSVRSFDLERSGAIRSRANPEADGYL